VNRRLPRVSAATEGVVVSRRRPAASLGRRSTRIREVATSYLFILPVLIHLLLFNVGAVIASLFLSFTDYDIITPAIWVGLENYRTMVDTPLFWRVLTNTGYYTLLVVPAEVAFSLFLAILVNRQMRGITVYKTLFFLPVVSSTVAVALVWSWLYNPQFGLINYALGLIGIEPIPWLGSTDWSMPAVAIMSVWKRVGYSMVLFIAGLQAIPGVYYEASTIDGASWFQRTRLITLPLVSPTTFFVSITSVIGAFQAFSQIYVMTEGGPAYSTTTVGYYVFVNAFQWFRMGYAASIAYVLFAIILFVTLVQFRLQREWVFYK